MKTLEGKETKTMKAKDLIWGVNVGVNERFGSFDDTMATSKNDFHAHYLLREEDLERFKAETGPEMEIILVINAWNGRNEIIVPQWKERQDERYDAWVGGMSIMKKKR